jgi:hypothetical protein
LGTDVGEADENGRSGPLTRPQAVVVNTTPTAATKVVIGTRLPRLMGLLLPH